MNHHLNLFRYYNESPHLEFLENNLSRAFSLTLLNSQLFFNEFIKSIITNEDYNYLFSTYSKENTFFEIDIQVDIAQIENESYKKVYAVALTANGIDFSDFLEQSLYPGKNITDILITINDIVLIVEVKKTGEDCKRQLYNQVYPFIKRKDESIHDSSIEVEPVSFTWNKVVTLMEKVYNLERVASVGSPFIRDFLKLAEIKRPNWFEPKPFNTLRFSAKWNSPQQHLLIQRMKQALARCKDYPVLDYSDRIGLAVNFGWASEIIPHFHHYENDSVKDYIGFHIWPGNTKTQGYHIFNKSLNWVNQKNILIDGKEYELDIALNIKICHFNRYITGLNYYASDLIKDTHTPNNFHNQSGKWDIKYWGDFELFMDEHFKPEFNWREKCKWDTIIVKTDRTYFTMSLGYEACTLIPYKEFCDIDKQEADIINVSNKIDNIVLALKNLI